MGIFRNQFIALNETIIKEYERLGLKHINEIEIDEKSPFQFLSNSLNGIIPIRNYVRYELETDIEFISMDLKYYTALLFLLRPYINYPLREGKTYFQTLEDKRYLSYASLLYQLLYNYWDRIGDFLYSFLETGLRERDVYFNRVILNLGNNYSSSHNYSKLKDVYDGHLVDLFENRKKIVHYLQIGARMFSGTFLHHGDEAYLAQLENEKEGYPEFFINHISQTFVGFEYSIKLINEKGQRGKSNKS